MLAISEDTASVGVVHETFAINGVSAGFLDTIDGPDIVYDSMSWEPDIELANIDFRCGASLFVASCPAEGGCVLLDGISLPCSLSCSVGWDSKWWGFASSFASQYSCMFCLIEASNLSMKILSSAHSQYTSPRRGSFATSSSGTAMGSSPRVAQIMRPLILFLKWYCWWRTSSEENFLLEGESWDIST